MAKIETACVGKGYALLDQKREKNAHLWRRDPLDFYVEPEWCSVRLFEQVTFSDDPACGLGRIVQAARDAGYAAYGTDIVLRSSYCVERRDFIDRTMPMNPVDAIVTNPPFKHAEAFVERALELANEVAMLLPANWRSGDGRSRWLEQTPLWKVLDITPRPSMPPGAVIAAGENPGGGREDFAWYIWKARYEWRTSVAVRKKAMTEAEKVLPSHGPQTMRPGARGRRELGSFQPSRAYRGSRRSPSFENISRFENRGFISWLSR